MKQDRQRRRWWLAGAACLLLAFAASTVMWRPALPERGGAPASFDTAQVRRGANLARLGMCAACHTVDAARPFAGGLALATPFGTVHSTNITPDARTGIGAWSRDAFTRAMRQGVARDGRLLYPAFPYPHYTRLAQDDIDALYAFFMTRPAIAAPARENRMRFPFNMRPLLGFWNLLYLDESLWQAKTFMAAESKRGAYLVDALAHCAACHTPRGALGALDVRRQFDGGEAEDWYAPALAGKSPSPVPWSREHLFQYLRTGIAPGHAVAAGPMQDVSVQLGQADAQDVQAIATYIHGYLAEAPARTPPRPGPLPAPAAGEPDVRMRLGHETYVMACARCHDAGRDAASSGALQLQAAVALYDPDPRSLLHIVREGIAPPEGEPGRFMPGFATILNDEQLTALAAYLRRYGAGAAPWEDLEDSVKKAKEQ